MAHRRHRRSAFKCLSQNRNRTRVGCCFRIPNHVGPRSRSRRSRRSRSWSSPERRPRAARAFSLGDIAVRLAALSSHFATSTNRQTAICSRVATIASRSAPLRSRITTIGSHITTMRSRITTMIEVRNSLFLALWPLQTVRNRRSNRRRILQQVIVVSGETRPLTQEVRRKSPNSL